MGNEMGNSNTSGLQEEENSTTEAQERSLQEDTHANGSKRENHIVPVAEHKDYHGKVTVTSDIPEEAGDSPAVNQILDGREQEETEVCRPAESPKFEVKSNETGVENSEIQPNIPSNGSKDQKNPSGYADDAQEYHAVPVAEGKGNIEKEIDKLASDDIEGAAEPHVINHISDEREQEETEVHSPPECTKVEVKSNTEEGGETSEIQPTSTSRDLKDPEMPPDLADVAEGENHIFPMAEGKDNHEVAINGLAFVVQDGSGDSHVVNQISDEREQKETEVYAPDDSLKVEVKSNNEAGCETSDIQPTSTSENSKDHEIQEESDLRENLLRISNQKLEKQASMEKEEEGEKNSTFDTIFSSNDPEPQESVDSKSDQRELATIQANSLGQDSKRSPQIIEDILGSNLTSVTEENGQPIGTNIPEDTNESVASVDVNPKDDLLVNELASEEEVSCEEGLENTDAHEISNGLGKRTMITSEFSNGVGIKCNGEIPIEVNRITSDLPTAKSEAISMDKSLNIHLEVSEAVEDCIVLTPPKIFIGKESEQGENKANHDPNLSCGESIKVSKIDKANVSTSEFVTIKSEPESNKRRTSDHASCDSGSNNDCIEKAKVAEDGQLVEVHATHPNEASGEAGNDSHKEAVMVLESGMHTTELFLTDGKTEEASEEKKIIEETEGKIKALYGIDRDSEETESLKQCMSSTLPLEEKKAFLQNSPVSHVQPQDNQQNHENESKEMQSSNKSISELKQGSCSEFFVAEASPFDSTNLMAGPLFPVAESAIKQDLSHCTVESTLAVAESKPTANHFSEQCAKVETPAFASDNYQAQGSVERLSSESNPRTSSIQAQMQKSPSFGLDLRIEARTEESDRTPLLYQDKTAIDDFPCQADISLGNPITDIQYGQDTLVYQAMPVEEKVVTMERSDSEKSKTPFLGFLKEKEEAHIVVTPHKHDSNTAAKKGNKELLNLPTEEVTSASSKSKERRKPRSSLFTNCMCCTTVIN